MATILTEYDYNTPEINTHIKDIKGMFDVMNAWPSYKTQINIVGMQNVTLSGNYDINEIMELCKSNTNNSLNYFTEITVSNPTSTIILDIIPMIESA